MIDTDCYCCPGCKKEHLYRAHIYGFTFQEKNGILTETANESAGSTYYKQQKSRQIIKVITCLLSFQRDAKRCVERCKLAET